MDLLMGMALLEVMQCFLILCTPLRILLQYTKRIKFMLKKGEEFDKAVEGVVRLS